MYAQTVHNSPPDGFTRRLMENFTPPPWLSRRAIPGHARGVTAGTGRWLAAGRRQGQPVGREHCRNPKTTPLPRRLCRKSNYQTTCCQTCRRRRRPTAWGQGLTRMLLRFQQISLMLTWRSKVTQPRRNQRRSGCGSAIAARRKPGYRRHICRSGQGQVRGEATWLTFSLGNRRCGRAKAPTFLHSVDGTCLGRTQVSYCWTSRRCLRRSMPVSDKKQTTRRVGANPTSLTN